MMTNENNDNRTTGLHALAAGEREDVAKLLTDSGTEVNVSAAESAVNVGQWLIDNIGADVNAKDADGATPLHWAAKTNAEKFAKMLIANGADTKAKDNSGKTPWDWAVADNAGADVAKLLGETE